MSWRLQSSEGGILPLEADIDLEIGAGHACALRLRGADMPARVASLRRLYGDAWLSVHATDPPIAINGRPVRALARVCAGDRLCFGTFCVDVLGDTPNTRETDTRCAAFALRVRGGIDSGLLHAGPLLHLDAEGRLVSAAAGRIVVRLADDGIELDPDGEAVTVNGHAVDGPVWLRDGSQIRIGSRRYIVESTAVAPMATAASIERVAAPVVDRRVEDVTAGEPGALWWLMGIAAIIAALVSGLLYYHG